MLEKWRIVCTFILANGFGDQSRKNKWYKFSLGAIEFRSKENKYGKDLYKIDKGYTASVGNKLAM